MSLTYKICIDFTAERSVLSAEGDSSCFLKDADTSLISSAYNHRADLGVSCTDRNVPRPALYRQLLTIPNARPCPN